MRQYGPNLPYKLSLAADRIVSQSLPSIRLIGTSLPTFPILPPERLLRIRKPNDNVDPDALGYFGTTSGYCKRR